MVLDDSSQIRTTLQGFSTVLKEMSQVCDVTALQEQLLDADRQVAEVQDSFTAPLSQLEHAAAVRFDSLGSFFSRYYQDGISVCCISLSMCSSTDRFLDL